MYNGIGLSTPRGSGTSGHIQSNLSNLKKPRQTRQDFLHQLKSLRDNVLAPPRKANPQIIQHQKKRQILIQVMKLRKKLQQDGVQDQEIQKRVEKAQKILKDKLEKGELQVESKDSHLQSQMKEKEYLKLRDAFKVDKDYKPGSAFDFEGQEQKRLERIANKQPKYVCKYEGCGKFYNIEGEYLRHIKYKHQNNQELLDQVRGKGKERREEKNRDRERDDKDKRQKSKKEQHKEKKEQPQEQVIQEKDQKRNRPI